MSRIGDKCFIYFMSLNHYPFRDHYTKSLIFAAQIVCVEIIRANLVTAKYLKSTGLNPGILIDLEK